MNLARKLERRLEQLIEGASSALFRGKVDAVELANRLVREADLSTTEGPAGDVAPNTYRISMSPADFSQTADVQRVVAELEHVVESTAVERGWRLEGPVGVTLTIDPALSTGAIRMETGIEAGIRTAWATLSGVSGELHQLRHTRVLVGRDDHADVRLSEWEASRSHALLWRQSGQVWIADLGSTNGSFVGSERLEETRALDSNNLLTFGSESFTFRQL